MVFTKDLIVMWLDVSFVQGIAMAFDGLFISGAPKN